MPFFTNAANVDNSRQHNSSVTDIDEASANITFIEVSITFSFSRAVNCGSGGPGWNMLTWEELVTREYVKQIEIRHVVYVLRKFEVGFHTDAIVLFSL